MAALAVLVVIGAIAEVVGLTIGGTAGRVAAVTAALVLVFASPGTLLFGWGYQWPLIGLGSVVTIGLTASRRPIQQ